jgi:hypothetical protein
MLDVFGAGAPLKWGWKCPAMMKIKVRFEV